MAAHVPVLLREVLAHLSLSPNSTVIDATLGGGGHAAALLEAIAPSGTVIGFEADGRTLTETADALAKYGKRFIPLQANFRQLIAYLPAEFLGAVDAILFDLGLSSIALADAERGFSFQQDGPLDMRFDPVHQTLTAADIVNTWPVEDLTDIFIRFGEERAAKVIARHLADRRKIHPFSRTLPLAHAVADIVHRRGRLHPATKVFQALRMAVNDELGALRDALPQSITALRPGGRLAIITFHSGEDRLVKEWSRQAAAASQLTIINKHVIVPARREILANPRARSAKLRMLAKPSPLIS